MRRKVKDSTLDVDASTYGQRLAKLLKASFLSAEAKAAWATLIPFFNFDQFKQLELILLTNIRAVKKVTT
jgi:hypothetical protein